LLARHYPKIGIGLAIIIVGIFLARNFLGDKKKP